MDFYKLTNFQLYAIIHSRHLDEGQKTTAQHELDRRGLTPEELAQLKEELAAKDSVFTTKFSANIYIAVFVLVLIMVLRQGTCN